MQLLNAEYGNSSIQHKNNQIFREKISPVKALRAFSYPPTVKLPAWFIGFVDDKTLPYAVCVVVNDAGEGSRHAAPIAARIFEFLNQNR